MKMQKSYQGPITINGKKVQFVAKYVPELRQWEVQIGQRFEQFATSGGLGHLKADIKRVFTGQHTLAQRRQRARDLREVASRQPIAPVKPLNTETDITMPVIQAHPEPDELPPVLPSMPAAPVAKVKKPAAKKATTIRPSSVRGTSVKTRTKSALEKTEKTKSIGVKKSVKKPTKTAAIQKRRATVPKKNRVSKTAVSRTKKRNK